MNDERQSAQNDASSQRVAPPTAARNSSATQPATEEQLQQTEKQIEKRMSAFERSMLRLTWAAVVVSILSAFVFGGQLYEMITGGTATDNLVKYARVQANAASDQADAAQQFSDTAEEINGRMSDAVEQLAAAASNAKAGIRATQDAMRLDQRAWVANVGMAMDAPELGKKLHGYVSWKNSGKSFAKKVAPLCHWVFVENTINTERELIKKSATGGLNQSIGVLAPSAEYKTLIETPGNIDETDKSRIGGTWYTYLWGELSYYDIFHKRHFTEFCSWRQGPMGEFVQCPFHNDAD